MKCFLDFGASLAYEINIFTFIESKIFERELPNYLNDDEYGQLQRFLMEHPEAGDIIPGSGGVRKLRWRVSGKGKRGGVRILYYLKYDPNMFWMLILYAKSKHDNLPAHIIKAAKEKFASET
jgi:hypothetical protein